MRDGSGLGRTLGKESPIVQLGNGKMGKQGSRAGSTAGFTVAAPLRPAGRATRNVRVQSAGRLFPGEEGSKVEARLFGGWEQFKPFTTELALALLPGSARGIGAPGR